MSESQNPYEVIINLMNQDDFRCLFETYFNDFSEIKSVILVMKTYHYLEKVYENRHGKRPTKEYMSSGIRRLMANEHSRRFLIESTNAFLKDERSFENALLNGPSDHPESIRSLL